MGLFMSPGRWVHRVVFPVTFPLLYCSNTIQEAFFCVCVYVCACFFSPCVDCGTQAHTHTTPAPLFFFLRLPSWCSPPPRPLSQQRHLTTPFSVPSSGELLIRSSLFGKTPALFSGVVVWVRICVCVCVFPRILCLRPPRQRQSIIATHIYPLPLSLSTHICIHHI